MPWSILGQELTENGNFEIQRLPPWAVVAAPGASVTLVPENSPFTGLYGAGNSSVRVHDEDFEASAPAVRQRFAATESILFGFDFQAPAQSSLSSWYVAWEGDDNTTAFFFAIGGADGSSLDFNQSKIAEITPHEWYHVEGSAGARGQKVEGFVTDTRGNRASFSGGFPFGVKNDLSAVVVSDGDAGPNEDILLDNFSSRLVRLSISRNAQGDEVVAWPSGLHFALEAKASLNPGTAWTPIATPDGSYTNKVSDPMQFYRLVQ
ncbi:MAG TPA: hypothetical protein VK633_11780 [Verrucomicrobiae bacterium]|nr:hypothetical protein [Verrucomicrobiae bacterium]